METYQNRHDFAQAQAPLTIAMRQSTAKHLGSPDRFKLLTKIIDRAEDVF